MPELLDDFFFRALLAAVGIALVAGPLGCFIVWRRMAYFGDTLAHSALLGVALGVLLGIEPVFGVAATVIVLALLLVALQQQRQIATDTLLGILAHSGLALGLVALSFLPQVRVDLLSYLFGDVLAVGKAELLQVYLGGMVALVALMAVWRPLLTATLHEELARAEGIAVLRVRLVFMLTIAIVIAVAMKIVGILLITSLLILPAATARLFARSPEAMALIAAGLAALAAVLGLLGSLNFDTPAGPSIIVAAAILFSAGLVLKPLRGD
ncbi:MAG: metal ABC transporter permease [Rhodovibrionaceae bacterium]